MKIIDGVIRVPQNPPPPKNPRPSDRVKDEDIWGEDDGAEKPDYGITHPENYTVIE